jgi:DNA polymerase-3 subunit alpha
MKVLYNIVSTFTLKNSLIKFNNLDKYLEDHSFDTLVLMDDNLRGYYKFYKLCVKHNIKPICGLTINITNELKKENEYILVAKNNEGLKDLFYISTQINAYDSFDFLKEIKKYENIYCIIPSYNKLILDYMNNGLSHKIKDIIDFLERKFLKVYFGLELNNIGMLSSFQNAFEIDFLPFFKISYINKSDYEMFDVIQKIEKNKSFSNYELFDRYYFKSQEEVEFLTQGLEFLDKNYNEFVDSIEIKDIKRKLVLPKYKKEHDSFEYLKEISFIGLNKRIKNTKKMDKYNIYLNRLKHELNIINQMNYSDYFLVVYDCVSYAKKNNILIGPGRGTSASSLVCYSLGITELDPIDYDLYFERFLNPERISMPDIDLDIPDNKREEVIKYLVSKYGEDKVASINTFVEFRVRSSIRDVCKVLNLSNYVVEEILKVIDSNISINDNLISNNKIIELYNHNEDVKHALDVSCSLEGLVRQTSSHAAGIILNNEALYDAIPLEKGCFDFLKQTQFEAVDLEELGFLKIDFLGIINLSIIDNVLKLIKDKIDIYHLDLNDSKTYKLLSKAKTLGIFQLESEGIKNVLRKLKPTCIEDLAAVIALYRPGPMKNIDTYVERKNGKKFEYFHPDLEPILNNTYGIIVYQEQIMKILHDFVGFSFGEADLYRRYISKKNEAKMLELKDKFINKCLERNYDLDVSNKLFEYILSFANYGFNKSHSVSYAMVSYQMSYLKANYPLEFFTTYLNYHSGNSRGIMEIFNEIRLNNIEIIPPTINLSQLDFSIYNGKIVFGLKAIKGLSNNSLRQILSHDKYDSFIDFINKTNITNKELEILIKAGYFDRFDKNRMNFLKKIKSNHVEYISFIKDYVFEEEKIDLFTLSEYEKEALGFNLIYDEFDVRCNKNNIERKIIRSFKLNDKVNILLRLVESKVIKTKNDKLVAILKFYDGFEEIEAVIFDYQYQYKLIFNDFYVVNGELRLNNKNNSRQIIIESLNKII